MEHPFRLVKYYSIAFAILPSIAGGLALELSKRPRSAEQWPGDGLGKAGTFVL
jgi:hypothetical protein